MIDDITKFLRRRLGHRERIVQGANYTDVRFDQMTTDNSLYVDRQEFHVVIEFIRITYYGRRSILQSVFMISYSGMKWILTFIAFNYEMIVTVESITVCGLWDSWIWNHPIIQFEWQITIDHSAILMPWQDLTGLLNSYFEL